MAGKSTDEILELMNQAQELGQALEASADRLTNFAINARNSLISLSGATEEDRKKINQLYADIEKGKSVFKGMVDDYTSAYIVAQNYYRMASKAGKDVSGLENMSAALKQQYAQLEKNLNLLKAVDNFMPKQKATSAQSSSGSGYTPLYSNLQEDLAALESLEQKMLEAGRSVRSLGNDIQDAMDRGKMVTAEGRQEVANLVAEYNVARQSFDSAASKFASAQYQLVQGVEAFEAKEQVPEEFALRLEKATQNAYELNSSLSKLQNSIQHTVSTSPDLMINGDSEALAKKNAKAQEDLNAVFSEQNRILQENRALLAQDQQYMKLQAEVATSAEGSVRQMTAQMKLYKLELENLSPTSAESQRAMDLLKDKINQLDVAIRQSSADQKKHAIDISAYGQATAYVASDIRRAIQALTQLRVEMGQVDTSTEEGKRRLSDMTAEYMRLTREIGNLKREYNTIKNTTQALGSQAGVVANVGSAVNAAVYGTQAFIGAVNLAGGSTTEWGQALVKLQSIMAITNGLTMTYNSLLKTGRLYALAESVTLKSLTKILGLKNAAKAGEVTAEASSTTASAAATAAQEAENAAMAEGVAMSQANTKAALEHAGAETTRAGAIAGSTAAMKIFNKAMKAGPLLLLALAIAALAKITQLITNLRSKTKALLEMNMMLMKQSVDRLEILNEWWGRTLKVQEAYLEGYKELAQAMHLYYTDIQKLTSMQWTNSANQWLVQLKAGLAEGLDLSEKTQQAVEKLGKDILTMAKWDPEQGMLVMGDDLFFLMSEIDREARKATDEVAELSLQLQELDVPESLSDLEADADLVWKLTGETKKMTTKELQDYVSAKLEAATSRKEYYLNLQVNGQSLITKFQKMQADFQREAMEVANTVLQAQNDAAVAAASNIEQRFNRERALARANTKSEIDQLKYRLKAEENLGVEGRAAINSKIAALERKLQIELREIHEEEVQAQIDAIRASEDLENEAAFDSHALRMKLLKLEYTRAREDLATRLAYEQDLTEIEMQEIRYQMAVLDNKYAKDRLELERELQQELIAAERSRYETLGEIAREGSEEEYQYAKAALLKQMEDELIARQQMTEEERALAATEAEIRIKYARAIADAEVKYETDAAQEIHTARMRWDKAFFNSKERSIRETAYFEMQQSVASLKIEREKYALQLDSELKLIELKLKEGVITEEMAKKMIDDLQPLFLTIDAIDREILNLMENWDKDLEFSNIWEVFGMSKRQSGAFKTFIDSLIDSLRSALDAWQEYYDKKAEMAQEDLDEAKSEYETQQELRAHGYANSVETAKREMEEKRRLRNQALRQQKEAERAQEELNTAEAASELIVAMAKVYSAFGWPLGAVMSGAMLAAFIGSKVSASRAASASAHLYKEGTVEMLEGGSHASGHDISLGYAKDGKERRAEGGEFFAIINKKNSRKYRSIIPDVINSLNDGTFAERYKSAFDRTENDLSIIAANPAQDLSGLERDVKGIREQGETRSYVDGNGNRIEVRKGLTRKIYKS